MDLQEFARQVRQGEKVLRHVDGEKLAAAAKVGDMQTLGRMLQNVLATPEGRELAQKVQKAVQSDGR